MKSATVSIVGNGAAIPRIPPNEEASKGAGVGIPEGIPVGVPVGIGGSTAVVGPSVGLVVGLHEMWGATVGWAVVGLQLICGITVGPDDGAALGAALGPRDGCCEEGGNEILSMGGNVGLDVRVGVEGLHETCGTGLVVGTGVSEKFGNITLLSVSI